MSDPCPFSSMLKWLNCKGFFFPKENACLLPLILKPFCVLEPASSFYPELLIEILFFLHFADVNTNSDVRYSCEFCGRSFYSKYNLDRHKMIHTGDKPFQCKICKKCFNQQANLKSHMIVHYKSAIDSYSN